MRTLLLILLTLLSLSIHATDSTLTWLQWKKTWPVENPKDFLIQPQSNDLVQSIEVLDMRSETSLIGLYTTRSQQPHAIKWNESPGNFFKQKLANGVAGLPLLFVIKHFWINELNSTVYVNNMTQLFPENYYKQNMQSKAVSSARMKCAIDVFVKTGDDAYCTLVRIDTSLVDLKRVDHNTEKIISQALIAINQAVTGSIGKGQYKSRKPISLAAIMDSYNRTFNIPLLITPIHKKGVYLSWDHFKNNQLSEANFIIQRNDKEPPMLYWKDESGAEVLARDVYAVCDGNKTFKVQDGYVFEMFFEPHCIYWMGIERQDVKNKTIPLFIPGPGMFAFGSMAVGAKVKIRLSPFLLNLETGQTL